MAYLVIIIAISAVCTVLVLSACIRSSQISGRDEVQD